MQRNIAFFMFLVLLLSFLAPAPIAHAAITVTVNSSYDDGTAVPAHCYDTVHGICGLRDAIAAAADGATINFAYDMMIFLVSELTIDKNLTITGTGHTVTVSGNHVTGIFRITDGSATFDLLTLTDGKAGPSNCFGGTYQCGGAINVQQYAHTVTVTNSTLSNNSAFGGGAIAVDVGTVTIANSTFLNNSSSYVGGAIFSFQSKLSVTNSTFHGNSAAFGGAISEIAETFYGLLTLTNNTIHSNTASNSGGGVSISWTRS